MAKTGKKDLGIYMKSFLTKNKKPIMKWSKIPNETFFQGKVPKGYNLTVSPSKNMIILDVDVKEKGSGFNYIPKDIKEELDTHFHYKTKNNGIHYWFLVSKEYKNIATKKYIDIRTNKGYGVWYNKDITPQEARKSFKYASKKIENFIDNLLYVK